MIESRINHLHSLGKKLSENEELNSVINRASQQNRWFTEENVNFALKHIVDYFLNDQKLDSWISSYDTSSWKDPDKTVGTVMAGNIPLVGFHDFLCAYILGFRQKIKLSSKDNVLLSHVISELSSLDKDLPDKVEVVDRLKDFDIVIATGSNNSNRYFEYYFRSYPKILRKNRNSVAVISGNESQSELKQLGEDLFRYFGLGCRNVSKIYVPKDYDIRTIISSMEDYSFLKQHSSYMNNFDYNLSVLTLNKTNYLNSDFCIWVESPSLASPLATIHFEYYDTKEDLEKMIRENEENIQCVVSNYDSDGRYIPFGQAQMPELHDYADNIDVINFLLGFK